MLTLLYILTALAFLGVVATLVMGSLSMSRTEESEREKSNKWMSRRVMLQAVAIILLFVTVYYRNQQGG